MLDRIEKLLNSLEENTAVFISSYPNIFYYSGFTSEDAYLLISKEKNILVTDSRYTIQAKEQAPDFEVCDITEGFENIFLKFQESVFGYEENRLTVGRYNSFKNKLPDKKELVPMQGKIEAPRYIKDVSEIKAISEAQSIADAAFSYVLPKIKAGKTEREIALELEFFMKKQGATALSFDTISASGVRSAMPHGVATDKVIENGDFLTLDFGCVYKGYCSDMTRTVVVGKANEKQKEIYNIVLTAQKEALKAIEVGKKCSEIDAVARDIIKKAGYGKNFGHGLGHSVGIEIHESPSLSPKCDAIIENGHILTVEPGIYIENFGGVRIEDLIAIENGKLQNLTKSSKDLIEL